MTERTFKIIQCCKANLYWKIPDRLERIKSYLAEECNRPKEKYTDAELRAILFKAMCDYIDTCDKPSTFLRFMYNDIPNGTESNLSFCERIATAFTYTRVKDDYGNYINGFAPFYVEDAHMRSEKEDGDYMDYFKSFIGKKIFSMNGENEGKVIGVSTKYCSRCEDTSPCFLVKWNGWDGFVDTVCCFAFTAIDNGNIQIIPHRRVD